MNYNIFFKDLRQYNSTNFRTLLNADLSNAAPETLKAFSSVITRYLIFCEKHNEIDSMNTRILYYKLKIDLIAAYFAEFPESSIDLLVPFQRELQSFVKKNKEGLEVV